VSTKNNFCFLPFFLSDHLLVLRSKGESHTDHNPIVLHLLLLAKSTTQGTGSTPIHQERPPRTQFYSSKLKHATNRKKISDALDDQASKAEQAIQSLQTSLQPREYQCDSVRRESQRNHCVRPATAQKIIEATEFRGKKAQTEHLTQRRQQDDGNYSSADKHIAAKQALIQTLRNKLVQSRQEGAPAHVIPNLSKSHARYKHELLKSQHQMRQKIVTGAVALSISVPNHRRTSPHSMWDLLRRYKTDHVQSNLPVRTHDNVSPDHRI